MDDVLRDADDAVPAVQDLTLVERTSLRDSSLWLALDQGGHASRALVFDTQGKQIAEAFAPINTQHSGEDRVEHDALEILQSIRAVINDVAHSLGSEVRFIKAAGLATQRSSVVCWDARDGTPLSPVLSWQDHRNADLINSLQAHRDEIQQLTGLVLSPHYGASKLRWCLDEISAVKSAFQKQQLQCGPLASYLLHGLLDEHPHLIDPANASRTQLWSPASGAWSSPLLQWFGVPREVLPQPVATFHHYGSVRVGNCVVPLQVCTGDQAAVPFATGTLKPNVVYLNIGTGAFMLAPLHHDVAAAAPLLRSVLFSDATQTYFALEGTVNGAGSALQWLGERSAMDVNRALPLLQRSSVTLSIPLFINAVGGVGSPYWLPNVQSQFVGVAAIDESAALIAVVESIAFLIAANIALMRMHLQKLDHIIVGGGVSACPYLCECIASLTKLPVMRIHERELTAKGLAWLTAGQPAHWSHDSGFIHYPVETDSALEARHEQWQQHMARLQSQFT